MMDEKEKVNAATEKDTADNVQKPPESNSEADENAESVNQDDCCDDKEQSDSDKDESAEKDDKKSKRALNKEIKALRTEKAALETKLADYDDRYKRMAAEYDNYRKRTAKEREGAYTDAYADALKEILPVIDNLERALTFADDSTTADDKLTEGVKMTLKQFADVLVSMNVEVIGAKGDKFDPELHNAVMHAEDESVGENEISEVFQKGYRREGKIIRYAMVKAVN